MPVGDSGWLDSTNLTNSECCLSGGIASVAIWRLVLVLSSTGHDGMIAVRGICAVVIAISTFMISVGQPARWLALQSESQVVRGYRGLPALVAAAAWVVHSYIFIRIMP